MSRRFLEIAILFATMAAPSLAKTTQRSVTAYFWVPEKDTSPYWTLADHIDCFTALAPTWLSFDASGKFTDNTDKRLIAYAHGHGVKVTPLVANDPFRASVAHLVFADADAVKRNVDLLLQSVKASGADGINVDIEGVAPADRPLYNAFVEALCTAFHKEKLLVTLDLPAKSKDAPTADWGGFAEYSTLGKLADQLQLMCYDEHWSSGGPGPVASLPWVRTVLEYVTNQAPREKIVMGVPFYGYDWSTPGHTAEVMPLRAYQLLQIYHQKPDWDANAQTYWFKYTDFEGAAHTVYYEHEKTLEARLELAREFGIAGIAIWRLGDETKGFWGPLKRYKAAR